MSLFDPPKRRYQMLKNMKINEVSLVTEPASPGAVVIFSKARDGAPDSNDIGAAIFAKMVALSAAGDLTLEHCAAAVAKGVFPEDWSAEDVFDEMTTDHRDDPEQLATAAGFLRKALAAPPVASEYLAGGLGRYVRRIAKGAPLGVLDFKALAAVHAFSKGNATMSTHDDKDALVRKGVETIEARAQEIMKERGVPYAKAFCLSAGETPALYAATRQLGGFAVSVAEARPVRKGITPAQSAAFYTPRSDDDAAHDGVYNQPEVDGAEDGNVNHENYGDASAECVQIARCAEDIRKASGYKLSEAQSFLRAAQAMPAVYAKARSKGAYRG